MFNWEKLGRVYNPLDFPDRPQWMYEFGLAPSTLVLEDVVRVYFGCRPKRDAKGMVVTYTSFLDLDLDDMKTIRGFSPTPVMTLGEIGTFDEFGTYPLSCIKREEDILAYYAGWTRSESVPFNVGIGVARSTDGGSSFSRIGQGPVIPFSLEEPFVMSGPKVRFFEGKYYLFYIAGSKWLSIDGRSEICHKIRMATSIDGINWIKQNANIIPDFWDPNESQASPDVFFSNGVYHMFFCGWVPHTFRKTRGRKIGYAWSHDLINWNRDDSKVGIRESTEGWDSEMVAYPHVFMAGGRTYMLYIGNEVGRYGFGLAVLNGSLK
jgi:predicted GH43/DUF377 family glycosyl hydrolase